MSGISFRFISLLVAMLAASSPALAAPPRCTLGKLAELPVTMDGLRPLVSAKVNGEPARLVVDSGAFFSMVTPRAAEKFKMSSSGLPGFYLQGAVGTTSARLGKAAEFELDATTFKNLEFLVAGDTLGDADGLLGQNILGILDIEYDLANGVVRIFRPADCEKVMLAYWATSVAAVSMMPIARTTPVDPHIYGRARVNDLPIRVAFDTGAGRSMLKLSTALKAGARLEADQASMDEAARGIGRRATDSYILPFSSLEIGNETIKNTRLRVAKTDFSGADMLLGADFFLSHRVFVSQSQHALYFTYNGGPVFRLDDEGVRAGQPSTAAPDLQVANAAGAAAAEALDVGALRRRAAAAAARHDYLGAIKTLDQAIAQEPDNADLYYDRARWRLASQAPLEGMRDLDKALKLKPAFADALVVRAHIRLAAGQVEAADADFQAALTTQPDQPDLELDIAGGYVQARQYERAIARLDAWLAKYPKSFQVGTALNERCWARALWGRGLDQALADCDLAIRRGSRVAMVFDSRGMVHLRRGEFVQALADYDTALKLQPKLAPSLYARGLAKLKSGDAAGGAADLRAAAGLEPKISEQMAELGISEATVVVAANR